MDEQNTLMTITITGPTVTVTGNNVLGFAMDNLVNILTATTDQSEDWSFTFGCN